MLITRDPLQGTEAAHTDILPRLLALANLIENVLTVQLRPTRITLGEYQVLQVMGRGSRRQVDLAHELQRSKVSVCRQVKRLLLLGCLSQDVYAQDRRAQWLRLTTEGHRVHQAAKLKLADTLHDLSQPLDTHAEHVLRKLLDNAEVLSQVITRQSVAATSP